MDGTLQMRQFDCPLGPHKDLATAPSFLSTEHVATQPMHYMFTLIWADFDGKCRYQSDGSQGGHTVESCNVLQYKSQENLLYPTNAHDTANRWKLAVPL